MNMQNQTEFVWLIYVVEYHALYTIETSPTHASR